MNDQSIYPSREQLFALAIQAEAMSQESQKEIQHSLCKMFETDTFQLFLGKLLKAIEAIAVNEMRNWDYADATIPVAVSERLRSASFLYQTVVNAMQERENGR